MIHIILQVLSIIGVILLSILGIFLLLICIVLFVPIRYEAYGEKQDTDILRLKVHWLLHIVTLRYDYPKTKALRIRLFGFTIYDSKRPHKPKKNRKSKKTEDKSTEEKNEPCNEENIKISEDEVCKDETKGVETDVPTLNKSKKEKRRFAPFRKLKKIFKKLKYTITHFYDTIKNIKSNMEYYLSVLKDEKTISLLKNCKKRIFKILKVVKPKVLKGEALLGTGSPDTMGYILGIYGMLIPYYGEHILLTPDFENKVLKGRIFVKGRIQIITLIINGAHILFDPNLKSVIRKLKREA